MEDLALLEGTLELQESPEAINVEPIISHDARGRLLVADRSEGYFRIYAPDGSLVNQFGGRGEGAGEFTNPAGLVMDGAGRLLALDYRGKAVVFSSDGDRLEATVPTPLTSVYRAAFRPDGRLLVAGTVANDGGGNRLHLLRLGSDSILEVESFLPTPVPSELLPAAATAGIVGVATRGDTIAATFALSDSIYLFGSQGDRLNSIAIPISDFRRATPPPQGAGMDGIAQWVDSFTMITDIFWLLDGSFIVQYQDRTDMLPDWRFVHLSRSGSLIGEVIDSPRILAGPDREGHLYFQEPGSLTPNRINRVSFQ